MSKYYFLCAALPPLDLAMPPPISVLEVKEQLFVGLSPSDYKTIDLWLSYIDLINLSALFWSDPIDLRGHFESEAALQEAVVMKSGFVDSAIDFLDKYTTQEDRRRFSSRLLSDFFRESIPKATGVMKELLTLEYHLRLLMTAWRAKRYGKDLSKEFEFEDPQDPFVSELLMQQNEVHFGFPYEYEELELVFAYISDPAKVMRKWLEYRYNRLNGWGESKPFDLDCLLIYFIQLSIVEDLHRLSPPEGKQWINFRLKEQEHAKYIVKAR